MTLTQAQGLAADHLRQRGEGARRDVEFNLLTGQAASPRDREVRREAETSRTLHLAPQLRHDLYVSGKKANLRMPTGLGRGKQDAPCQGSMPQKVT